MTTTLHAIIGSCPTNRIADSTFFEVHTTEAGADAAFIAMAVDDHEEWDGDPLVGDSPATLDAAVAYFADHTDWYYTRETITVKDDDLESSASRQHFIETGVYLTVQESHEANPHYCTFWGVTSPCSVCGARRTTKGT